MIKVPFGKHRGDRCFIIGSGPSIKKMDLSPLRDEITICVNESYRALDWEPDYICIGDRELWPRIKDKYAKMSSKIICSTGTNGKVGEDYAGDNLHARIPMDTSQHVLQNGFNWDLEKPVHKAWNVVPEIALPFVCWAGFSECYLIGVDCTNTGYFYEDPARGPGWQKVTENTMRCYDLIACLKDLPTKILNAGAGGNLWAFPRVDFQSLFPSIPSYPKKDLLVVGYYTPNNNYRQLAESMKASVEKQGLECVIQQRRNLGDEKMPKPMPWVLNCSQCGPFVREMMSRYPGREILYLDADAEMRLPPEILLSQDFQYDFAAPFLTNAYVQNELVSNTLYFAPTAPAKSLVKAWCRLQADRNDMMLKRKFNPPFHQAWDQQVLQDVLLNVPNLRWTALPWTYAKMDATSTGVELMPGVAQEEIVISQHQASRQNKGKV